MQGQAQTGAKGAKEEIQDNAHKNGAPQPVIVHKGLEALIQIPFADQKVMVDRHTGSHRQPGEKPGAPQQAVAHPADQTQGRHVASHDGRHIVAAKGNSGGFDADFQVVGPVHDSVFGVVGHGPENIGQKQEPGIPGQGVHLGSVGHRNTKAEGDAQIGLGNGEKALGEGIGGGQEGPHQGQLQHQNIFQGQDQDQGHQTEEDEQGQGFLFRHPARRQGPVFGAMDVPVEMPVGVVIDDTAGGAHEKGAQDENPHPPPVRLAQGRKPQGPEGGPQQQQGADGLIQPHQLFVGINPLSPGCRRTHAVHAPEI